MNDSDFTIGFKQGQEHGKQIMLEKIEDIKNDIKEQKINRNTLYVYEKENWWNCALEKCLEIIDKHISGKEQK